MCYTVVVSFSSNKNYYLNDYSYSSSRFVHGLIMGLNFPIRVVTVVIELAISANECDCLSPNSIAEFLNRKLHSDPDFFGDFAKENIVRVEAIDS
jgi:hypothetical protein